MALRCKREVDKSIRKLDRRKRELAALERCLKLIVDTTAEDVEEAMDTVKQSGEATDAVRGQLQILEDMTIPGMVRQNTRLLALWDAETAIQVRRQVAAQVDRD